MDAFLLAFVFFVFAFGLYKIFFIKDNSKINDILPSWLHIVVRISANNLSWTFLMFAAGILLISISFFYESGAIVTR